MPGIQTVLIICALVCWFMAAFEWPVPGVRLIAAGLFFAGLVMLVV